MAWPFSSAGAPNVDTGQVAVPTSATSVTASACWLMGASFSNTTSNAITVTVTDTAGDQVGAFVVPGGGVPVVQEWPFMPLTGLKWSAGASGVTGHLWGYA